MSTHEITNQARRSAPGPRWRSRRATGHTFGSLDTDLAGAAAAIVERAG